MTSVTEEAGHVYGWLTVIRRFGTTSDRQATWLCICKCGRRVVVRGINLRRGRTKSCGCLRRENTFGRAPGRTLTEEEYDRYYYANLGHGEVH